MKLGIASLVGLRNIFNDIHTEEDLESVINIDNEPTSDVESNDLRPNETKTQVTMNVDTETETFVDSDATCKTPTMPTATNSRAQKVKRFRKAAREGLEKQAKKMKAVSARKFEKPTLGQNVIIKIPDIDRAKMDPKSVIAVVTDIKDEEFYELGTEFGKLNALYTINQFTLCKDKFLSVEKVPTKTIPLRAVAKKSSLVGGQGFKKCNCLQKCKTNRCLCKSSNLLCNSKCHNSQPCRNK